MRKIGTIATLGLALGTTFSSPGRAETPPPAWVTEEFGRLMQTCLPGIDKIKFRKKPKEGSLIPQSVLDELRLPDSFSYQDFGNANMSRLFGYVYSETEKNVPASFVPDDKRYLQIDYARDNDQIAEPGLGAVVYERDCKGALDLAVQGRANAEFAPATLQAAARSALTRNFSASLSLYKGNFQNPIPLQWYGQTNLPKTQELMQVYAAMLFWDWYRLNGTGGGKHYLLRAVNGISLYRFSRQSSGTENTASASANFAIPFLSAGFEGSGNLQSDTEVRLDKFRFARVDAGENGSYTQFVELPSITQVLEVISGVGSTLVKVRVAEGEDDIARPGSQKNFYLEAEGLPFRYCSRLMEVGGANAGSFTLGEPSRGTNAAGLPICRFPLRYTVPATGAEQLSFSIRPKVFGLPDGVRAFEIPVSYSLARSETPTIVNMSQQPVAAQSSEAAGADTTTLRWQVAGLIKDGGSGVDDIDRSEFGPQSCPEDAERLSYQLGHTMGQRVDDTRPITFTVTGQFRNLKPDWRTRAVVCRIGGQIKFRSNGLEVPRLISGFEILVPDAADTLPLARPDTGGA